MKKWGRKKSRENNGRFITAIAAVIILSAIFTGCGEKETQPGGTGDGAPVENEAREGTQAPGQDAVTTGQNAEAAGGAGIQAETAGDARIDFKALKRENPEIFAWLYVPGTSIDAPVMQSMEDDAYYETHNALGKEDGGGALYIEAANLTSMCDFNTVIHGRSSADGENGIFNDLYRFADPDFFDSHEQFYVYLEDNVLTYEVFAAYEREDTSLIREYDFTYIAGCEQFLQDMYSIREMAMMIRSGWRDVTPYHFLVTLSTVRKEEPDRQFVVLGALTEDPAGKIDRVVIE